MTVILICDSYFYCLNISETWFIFFAKLTSSYFTFPRLYKPASLYSDGNFAQIIGALYVTVSRP